MRHALIAAVLLGVLLAPTGCARRAGTEGDAGGGAAASAEATTPTGARDDAVAAVGAIDVARLLGARTDFAEASLQEAAQGTEAVATVQMARGAKAAEPAVFAVLAAMADAAPNAAQARLEIWTPGEPDARFAQYVWNRANATLERFEASLPSGEFDAYAPVGDPESAAPATGFDAGRTGAMDAIDVETLGRLAASAAPQWDSETP